MPTMYESLRIFIASPGDVSNERDLAKKTIEGVRETCRETLGLDLHAVTWEDLKPEMTNLPEQTIQEILNAQIPRCHVFVLILWKRHGSKEIGQQKTNTEREVEIALKVLEKEKKLMFLPYFRNLTPDGDKGPQREGVERFRRELEEKGILYSTYSAPEDFKENLTNDLYRTVMRFRLSTRKHELLRKFWLFGTPDRPTYPVLAIIYPSMERAFMGPGDDSDVWLNRLEPNVVFEDFKALQKLEKTLRIIGFRDFRIFNSSSIPADLRFMNRFWICLPRNNPGIKQARLYSKVSRFELVRKVNRATSFIKWTSPNVSDPIIVRSPLATYLYEQRSRMDISDEWRQPMDHIVGKDYAILARFRDESADLAMNDGVLYDYFLAGLRGLGTWGAAWYLDRMYPAFRKMEGDENVQLLLEVEYRDGRIYAVRDVSDKPQSYFKEENKKATIKKNIDSFEPSRHIPFRRSPPPAERPLPPTSGTTR